MLLGREAVETYRNTVSREPAQEHPDAIDELVSTTNQAIRFVARHQMEQALPLLQNAMHLIERAIETLSREERGARQALDACLVLSRLYLETGRLPQAREHTLGCRRLVPDLTPLPRTHPPEVVELVRTVDAHLARMPAIRVESTPSQCPVLLNGRELGTTPFEVRAPQGQYRVQVVCDVNDSGSLRSRVRELILGSESVTIRFDVNLDQAILSEENIILQYRSSSVARRRAHRDAETIGRQLHVSTVLHLSAQASGWRLDRVRVHDGRPSASVWLSESPSAQEASLAIEALRVGRSLDLSGSEPRVVVPWAPDEAGAPPRAQGDVDHGQGVGSAAHQSYETDAYTNGGRIASGLSLSILGLGAISAGIYSHRQANSAAVRLRGSNRLVVGFVDMVDSFDGARRRNLILSGSAALFLSAGIPLLARRHARTPWWSWTIGAAGLAAVFIGALVSAGSRQCLDADCLRRSAPETIGALLLAAGLPLVVLPFAQTTRRLNSREYRSVGLAASLDRVVFFGVF
ncbi:MAG: PEGA domain-containing protein [Myxococcales bacterium]|nr:PEGA domain-containing protein [Myxococcales bacterium]